MWPVIEKTANRDRAIFGFAKKAPIHRRKPACSGVDVTSPEIAVLAGPADARIWARPEAARGPGDHQHVSPRGLQRPHSSQFSLLPSRRPSLGRF